MVVFVVQFSLLVNCFTFLCWANDVSVAAHVRFYLCWALGLLCPREDACQGVCILKTTVGAPLARVCMGLQSTGDFFRHSILKI